MDPVTIIGLVASVVAIASGVVGLTIKVIQLKRLIEQGRSK
ncbi:hypothetical protein [Pseudomonas sp.]|nr:hypothetical protein [Pseudomonas sp.]